MQLDASIQYLIYQKSIIWRIQITINRGVGRRGFSFIWRLEFLCGWWTDSPCNNPGNVFLFNKTVKMLREIMVTQCAHRRCTHWLQVVLTLLVDGSANNGLLVASCQFNKKSLFRKASWLVYFVLYFSGTGCYDWIAITRSHWRMCICIYIYAQEFYDYIGD
jgi:hypothetical protein